MRLMKKSLVLVGVGIVIALSSIYLTAFVRTRAEERRAGNLLSIVLSFNVGKMKESEAMHEVQPFLSGLGSKETDNTGGEYRSFVFDNIEMSKLKLSHYRRFAVRLKFRDGILFEKNAEFSVENDCRIVVIERVYPGPSDTKTETSSAQNHFSTVPSGFNKPVASATIIDDDTYAESLREADWKFNLAYLTRLGGCEDARAILPAITR